jgi:hypothetical protein
MISSLKLSFACVCMSASRPWLPMPSAIRSLFTAFPLKTFPSSPLPSNSTVTVPRLYIYNTTSNPMTPSWDAKCLKWQVHPLSTKLKQTFFQLEFPECIFVTSSRSASPSGELPFLVQPNYEIVPLHKLHRFVVSKFEIPANSRMTAYLNLIDTKIHAAWVRFQCFVLI